MTEELECNQELKSDLELETIQSEADDLEIDNASYDIRTYGADFTIEILSKKFDTKEIIIPDFQRRYVWPPKKAARLIESFLLGLPVPQVFLFREENNKDLLVVDGQQRLRTINYFINEKFENGQEFILRGVRSDWDGKKYSTLTERDRRSFNNYILRATIFEQVNPSDNSSIFEIFERLNTGGVALNEQEIRRCVVRGPINEFIDNLNKYPNWRKLLNRNLPDSRMKDSEMILRFLALSEGWSTYKKPMKDFITTFMKEKQNINEDEMTKYRNLFEGIVDKILKDVGKEAFQIKAGINVAVFDSIMVALSTMEFETVSNLREKIGKLKSSDEFNDAVSVHTTDSEKVGKRIGLAIKIIGE